MSASFASLFLLSAGAPGMTVRFNRSPIALGAFFPRDFFRSARLVEINISVFLDNIEPIEKLVLAGAIDAKPGIGLKEGAMARADKMFLVLGMKMIGEYFQRDELMRAGIDIGMMLAVFLNHHDVEPVGAFAQHYAFRTVRGDLFGPAK